MYWYNEIKNNLRDILPQPQGIVALKNRGKNARRYLKLYCGFDIETTTTPSHFGYMYNWQLSINNVVIMGKHWYEWIDLLEQIKKKYTLRKSTKIIIWIANLGFEFQFMRKYLNITRLFAKRKREPLYFEIDDCIEFRDCLAISGGSLKQLAKDYTITQKLDGDLDYSIQRNYLTPLNQQELNYCINDVVILSEFSEYIFKTYIEPSKYIPLTKTNIIRKAIKQACPDRAKEYILMCYPNHKDYIIYMNFLFRGGYVHSNRKLTNKILIGVSCGDITSSYPDTMNNDYVPVSPFKKACISDFNYHLKHDCCIIHATFTNLINTTSHSIESENKVISISNKKIIDNGRIMYAQEVEVLLTELDFKIYQKFYKWDNIKIHSLKVAKRGKLPQYLLQVLNKAYIDKANLKKQGLQNTTEYAQQKSVVNSTYGVTVTKLVTEEITYINDNWDTDSKNFNYYKEIKKQVLLPQWGIWITAHSRAKLLNMVYKMHKDVVYCDTDSIYFLNYEKNIHHFEEYNKSRTQQNLENCKKHNLPFEIFNDLGNFEIEMKECDRFKTLGAKRYIYEKNNKQKVTIAGLPKKSLVDYCKNNNLDIFDTFQDKMLLDIDCSFKKANTYNDQPHTEIIDGVQMTEQSSVGIFSISFQMKLNDVYKQLLKQIKEMEHNNYGNRIY